MHTSAHLAQQHPPQVDFSTSTCATQCHIGGEKMLLMQQKKLMPVGVRPPLCKKSVKKDAVAQNTYSD
jgi:hypothetical protein